MTYDETRDVFRQTIKLFQERNNTLSQAYRVAFNIPLKFYRDKTPDEAYAALCDQYP